MKNKSYSLRSEVILWPGMAAWHFAVVPKKEAAKIKELFAHKKGGFGSIKVNVTIGETTWNTSIFPDKKSGTYLLPIKKAVRQKEGIFDGDTIAFAIEIL